MISSDDVPAALPSREEALSVDLQDATLSDQNMSIENDSVLNGEVEQILARESTMVRASYDSFRTGSVSENEDFEFEAGNGADVQAAKAARLRPTIHSLSTIPLTRKCKLISANAMRF
jgi:hypothetical protein